VPATYTYPCQREWPALDPPHHRHGSEALRCSKLSELRMRITSEPFKGATLTVTSRGAKSATVRMKLNRHLRCACRWWANSTQSWQIGRNAELIRRTGRHKPVKRHRQNKPG